MSIKRKLARERQINAQRQKMIGPLVEFIARAKGAAGSNRELKSHQRGPGSTPGASTTSPRGKLRGST